MFLADVIQRQISIGSEDESWPEHIPDMNYERDGRSDKEINVLPENLKVDAPKRVASINDILRFTGKEQPRQKQPASSRKCRAKDSSEAKTLETYDESVESVESVICADDMQEVSGKTVNLSDILTGGSRKKEKKEKEKKKKKKKSKIKGIDGGVTVQESSLYDELMESKYYKSEYDVISDGNDKWNSSDSLSLDDDFAYYRYKKMSIARFNEHDVAYDVSSGIDDGQWSSHISKLSDSLLFKFRSDKLKKGSRQKTDDFLARSDKNQFLVTVTSPKLKQVNTYVKKTSLKDLLTGKTSKPKNKAAAKTQQYVTLRLPPEFLQKIQNKMEEQDFALQNPFFTAGSNKENGENSFFFRQIKERSKKSKNTGMVPKPAKKQTMELRPLRRDEFHVTWNMGSVVPKGGASILARIPRVVKSSRSDIGECNETGFDYGKRIESPDCAKSCYETSCRQMDKELYAKRVSQYADSYNWFSSKAFLAGKQLWCESSRPRNCRECIQNMRGLYVWLQDSFNLLRDNYQSKLRTSYLKDVFLNKKSYFLDDFVVPDGEEEQQDVRNEGILKNIHDDVPYIPLMILTGPIGCGKTAGLYACIEELHGYVHEINTSQNHSKKALHKLLKELSTSKTMHQQKRTGFFAEKTDFEYQDGVILFENIDVLFKPQDKGFWELFASILQITRKPIILTCSDPDMLPAAVVQIAQDQNTYIELSRVACGELVAYLDMVCCSLGYDVDESVLVGLVGECGNDLRKCLNNLQYFCEGFTVPHKCDQLSKAKQLLTIKCVSTVDERINQESLLLAQLAHRSDIVSMADVINTGCCSTISKDDVINTFEEAMDDDNRETPLDVQQDMFYDNYLDDEFMVEDLKVKMVKETSLLGPQLEHFELNIGSEVLGILSPAKAPSHSLRPHIIDIFRLFLQLRIKKSSNTARLTRSSVNLLASSSFEDLDTIEILPLDSIVTCPFDKVVAELGPILRVFAAINSDLKQKNEYIMLRSGLDEHQLAMLGILKPLSFDPQQEVFSKLHSTGINYGHL